MEEWKAAKMKIRVGFVSNSSTTSFSIYGIWLDHPELPMREKIESSDLFWCLDELGDGLYVGRTWKSIQDTETGRQFKEWVENKLKDFGITEAPTSIDAGWRDG